MNDQADIATYAHRPEILVLGTVQLVETHAWTRRIQLQVEGSRFNELLLFARQPCEAVGKGVGNSEFKHEDPVYRAIRQRRLTADPVASQIHSW